MYCPPLGQKLLSTSTLPLRLLKVHPQVWEGERIELVRLKTHLATTPLTKKAPSPLQHLLLCPPEEAHSDLPFPYEQGRVPTSPSAYRIWTGVYGHSIRHTPPPRPGRKSQDCRSTPGRSFLSLGFPRNTARFPPAGGEDKPTLSPPSLPNTPQHGGEGYGKKMHQRMCIHSYTPGAFRPQSHV